MKNDKHTHDHEDLTEEEINAQDDQIGEALDEAEDTLEETQGEEAKLRDQLIRLHAQMENIKMRAKRDVESAHKFASEKLLKELLPILDSLEHALAVSQDAHESVSAMIEGLELTHKMLLGTLEKLGVKVLNPVGEMFDPNQHEAMTMVPSPEHQPNTVIDVVQKGYSLHDRVVRPARVVVSKSA